MGKQTISIYVDDRVVEWLDIYTEKLKMNRSQLIEFILTNGTQLSSDFMDNFIKTYQALLDMRKKALTEEKTK